MIIKLLHWNIHMWLTEQDQSNYNLIKKFIEYNNPDIVTLTEVEDIYNNCLVSKLAKELNYMLVFCPCFDFIYESERYSFGNSILSKFPFKKVENKIITPTEFLYNGCEESEPRNLTLVEILGIDNFSIGITHLPRKIQKYKNFSINNLKKFIPKEKFLIAGDFNIGRNELSDYFNSYSIYPLKKTYTYPCSNPSEDIDHIITQKIKVYNCNIINNFSSDHFPIIINFEV